METALTREVTTNSTDNNEVTTNSTDNNEVTTNSTDNNEVKVYEDPLVVLCLCISPNQNGHCKNKIFTD